MHPIDEAILRDRLTVALLDEHAAKPLPAAAHSYWGDHMHAGHTPIRAARLAARDMGTALTSLRALDIA
jgi:hypothetical protein